MRLRAKTKFGRKVRFIPRGRGEFLGEHPIVAQLTAEIDKSAKVRGAQPFRLVSELELLKPRFKRILKELSPKLTQTDVAQIEELVDAGELIVAFENFCTQLYERDAGCSANQIHEMILIGEELKIKNQYWTIISKLDVRP